MDVVILELGSRGLYTVAASALLDLSHPGHQYQEHPASLKPEFLGAASTFA